MSVKKLVPVPYQLSMWDSMTEIFYECHKCKCDMRLLGRHQNYCYKCGQALNWDNLPTNLIQQDAKEYWGIQNEYEKRESGNFVEMRDKQRTFLENKVQEYKYTLENHQ